ncbi:hypothetical protein YC2023_020363 [Brassica napus]
MKSMVKRRRSFNPSFCYVTQRMRRREQVTYQLSAESFGTGIEALKENNTP